MGFLDFFSRKSTRQDYDFSALVDARVYDDFPGDKFPLQIICDIDKTYLETQFESLIKMARVALERASDKLTVAGAADVLTTLRWATGSDVTCPAGWPRPVHFVSSSPPQLRSVLQEKLTMDGLDWSTDTFKNQAYNVFRGRMDQLRQHVGYKSAAILNVICKAGDGTKFLLMGDNAEADAFIYLGVCLRLQGLISPNGYARYLSFAGLDSWVADKIAAAYATLPKSEIGGIFIRKAPGYKFVECPVLADGIQLFDDYFQLTILLVRLGFIPTQCLPFLTRRFANRNGFTSRRLAEHLATLYKSLDSNNLTDRKLIEESLVCIRRRLIEPESFLICHEHPSLHLTKHSESELLGMAKKWAEDLARND